jgi:hypothetical protein
MVFGKRMKAAAISFTLVSSVTVGTAFANVEAGSAIFNWYYSQFDSKAEQVSAKLVEQLLVSKIQLDRSTQQMISKVGEEVNDFKRVKATSASSEINNHLVNYQNRLQSKKNELQSEDLQEYSKSLQKEEVEKVDNEVESILEEVLNN